MSTVAFTLVSAVLGALSLPTPVADQVSRVRFAPVSAGVESAVSVRPLSCERDTSPMAFGAPSVWQVRLGVDLAVRAQADDVQTAEQRLDSLVQTTLGRLMTDPTLAGAVPFGIEPAALSYDFEAAGDLLAVCTLQLTARVTAQPDLT